MKNKLLKIGISFVLVFTAVGVTAFADTPTDEIEKIVTNVQDDNASDVTEESDESSDSDETAIIENETSDEDENIEDNDLENSVEDGGNDKDELKVENNSEDQPQTDAIELTPLIEFQNDGSIDYVTVETLAELNEAITTATQESKIILSSTFDMSTLNNYSFKNPHSFMIELDANHNVLEGSMKYQQGKVTVSNLIVDGLYSGQADRLNIGIDVSGAATETYFESLTIRNSKSGLSVGSGYVYINNSTFENISSAAGALSIGSSASIVVTIENSEFVGNVNDASGYDGGAIASKNHAGKINIYNTIFKNNKAMNGGNISGARGGAIAINYSTPSSVVNIIDSYFVGNHAGNYDTESGSANASKMDGGAISYFASENSTLNISGTTFVDNHAIDDGGALLIQSVDGVANNTRYTTYVTIDNSTFYGNIARGRGDSDNSGGAIQTYNVVDMDVKGSTFAYNQAYDKSSFLVQKGAAIATAKYWKVTNNAVFTFQDNLFVGNSFVDVKGNIRTSSKNNNVLTTSSTTTDNGGNIGLDHVSNLGSDVTTANILGNYETGLTTNRSSVYAGRTGNRIVVPTLPIIPSNGTKGIANNSGTNTLAIDQRGFARSGDAGSVDISWIRYDANGGNFNLSELSYFDGSEYYEGSTPTTYDIIRYYGYSGSVLGGDDLSITHSNTTKVFEGWSTDASATVADVNIGESYSLDDGDITLYAVWSDAIEYFDVTFESNGGSSVDPIENVVSGSLITKPTDPTKANYTFAGWYKDAALTQAWNFDTDVVTGNMTLYADWSINKYTVTFESNGGSDVASIENVEVNTTITKPADPTKVNYTFAGWYKDASLTQAWNFDTDVVTGNMTLYADWSINEYTVTFESNGGSDVASIENVEVNTTITKPSDPTKTNYTFAGWYKDASLTQAWNFDTDVVTGNMTLYADWSINKYTVTFESNGGSDVASIENVEVNTTITKPSDPTKVNYTFAGWYKDASLTQAWNFDTDVVTGNMTLYADWSINEYTVTFESNGGSDVASIENVEVNTTITKPADPTKVNYIFSGWYKDVALTQAWDFEKDVVSGDVKLYAKWENVAKPIEPKPDEIKPEEPKLPGTGISDQMMHIGIVVMGLGLIVVSLERMRKINKK